MFTRMVKVVDSIINPNPAQRYMSKGQDRHCNACLPQDTHVALAWLDVTLWVAT